MTLGAKPLTSTPGQFYARCSLTEHRWERRLTDEERAEAKANGYSRVFVELEHERVDRETRKHGRWEICFPACAGFETTDPVEYEQHLREVHGRQVSTFGRGVWETFSASVRAGWRSPRLAAEGKPLTKQAAAQLRRCPTCDLYGEVDSNASELWWDEHVRGCSIAVSAQRAEAS